MRNVMLFVATGTCLLATSLSAHHSDAALDLNALHTIEGLVTDYRMRNPHGYFTVETTDENGQSVEWSVQMGSALSVSRRGWTRDTLTVGDQVIVGVRPARDGRSYGMLATLEKDGIPITYERFRVPETGATTRTLEGIWITDRASLGPDFPGGFDELTRAELTLTEKGQIADDAYTQNSEENSELWCITKPTPGDIMYTDTYPIQIEYNEAGETIIIRSQFFDQVRTVYMDGREHPPADERTHEGHSIGSWEDDVLVIDTRNFADNRSPYQNGIPSGAQKHVVERYRLHEDGTRLTVEFMLEDSEYIVGSMTHSRDLIYSPQIEMTPFDCDEEATRGFLPQ